MIYFSPKLLVVSISGIGVVGCGLLTWQLTKNKKIDWDTAEKEVTNTCGEYVWYDFAEGSNKVNSKGKKLSERNQCKTHILGKYGLNPPLPPTKKNK